VIANPTSHPTLNPSAHPASSDPFTDAGDHLSGDEDRPGELHVFVDHCWFSVPLMLDSVAKLLRYDWLTVLPGHGRRCHLQDAAHRLRAVSTLLAKHHHQGS
jgi:hypothetical protein